MRLASWPALQRGVSGSLCQQGGRELSWRSVTPFQVLWGLETPSSVAQVPRMAPVPQKSLLIQPMQGCMDL